MSVTSASADPALAPDPIPRSFTRALAASALRPGCRLVALSAPADGAGRTTLAAHLAVAALQRGVPTGVVDLDLRDRGLTRWLRRRAEADEERGRLPTPLALDLPPLGAEGEIERWPTVEAELRASCELVLADLPAGDDPLARAAVASADWVITVVADSPVDLDRLLDADAAGRERDRPSAYARMIWQERVARACAGGEPPDWRILRTRRLERDELADARFAEAEQRLGAWRAPVFADDPAWREGFAEGLTALDLGRAAARATPAAAALRDLLIALRLPRLQGAELTL